MRSAGSSPRLRGTPARSWLVILNIRFIPAPAGNAHWHKAPSRQMAVHPRACGERAAAGVRFVQVRGSSPRLRGTRWCRRSSARVKRFIPAPAGNARAIRAARPVQPVHPRACGERSFVTLCRNAGSGSSPRLRGTRDQSQPAEWRFRFIPAPAGNAVGAQHGCHQAPVHPRACGERLTMVAAAAFIFGSSPRLRGTQRAPTRR